jgi:hypothetical protein
VTTGGVVNVGDAATLHEAKHRAFAEAARRTKRLAFGAVTSVMDRFSR